MVKIMNRLYLKGGLGLRNTIDSQKYVHNAYSRPRCKEQALQFDEQYDARQYALELKDISPIWDCRLKEKWPIPFSTMWFKRYFELKRTSRCVVGEAHGFSSSYLECCKECDDIGWKFIFYFTINSRKKLELNQKRFVGHWNEIHMNNRSSTGPVSAKVIA